MERALTKASITLFALLLRHATADANATCYYPSGDVATGYFPCVAENAYISACCQNGWTCYSNSLCVLTSPGKSSALNLPIGTSQRGACTDPNWSSDVCGGFCLREIPSSIVLARFVNYDQTAATQTTVFSHVETTISVVLQTKPAAIATVTRVLAFSLSERVYHKPSLDLVARCTHKRQLLSPRLLLRLSALQPEFQLQP